MHHYQLYSYNQITLGVASVPSMYFPAYHEKYLEGTNHVCVYLDNILVTGANEQEHLQNLLRRLETADMRLTYDKRAFVLSAVECLGHKISAKGLQPTDDKIQAIKDAPVLTDVLQLKSF